MLAPPLYPSPSKYQAFFCGRVRTCDMSLTDASRTLLERNQGKALNWDCTEQSLELFKRTLKAKGESINYKKTWINYKAIATYLKKGRFTKLQFKRIENSKIEYSMLNIDNQGYSKGRRNINYKNSPKTNKNLNDEKLPQTSKSYQTTLTVKGSYQTAFLSLFSVFGQVSVTELQSSYNHIIFFIDPLFLYQFFPLQIHIILLGATVGRKTVSSFLFYDERLFCISSNE